LSEWQTLANELMSKNASFEEFKTKMRNLSAYASVNPSPVSSPVHTENDDMNMEEDKHKPNHDQQQLAAIVSHN
jgi:hypothetical protein